MMGQKGNQSGLLLVYTQFSTFVERDFELLSQTYEVQTYSFKPGNSFRIFYSLILQFFFLVFNGHKFKKILIWFADSHSLLPVLYAKLLRKQSALIIGGFDATGVPEIRYGILYSNAVRRMCNYISIKYATFVLPVDQSLIMGKNNYADPLLELPVGVKYIVKNPKGKVQALPTGYNPDYWKKTGKTVRQDSILTVAYVRDHRTWLLKGGDLLLEIARNYPQIELYFYGLSEEFQKQLKTEQLPPNFHLFGFVNPSQLPELYSAHKVYAQLSLSEGLPNALCEAMLCECIPVGSRVNGIPEVIGDTGFVLDKKEVKMAGELLKLALDADTDLGEKARNRISGKYDIGKRKQKLLHIWQ